MQVDRAEQLWTACAAALREQVSEAVWLTTFSVVTPLALDDDILRISVPSSVVKERIENRYQALVDGALSDIDEPEIALDIIVKTDDGVTSATASTEMSTDIHREIPSPGETDDHPSPAAADAAREQKSPALGLVVNPRYTFDAFVIGTSNRFAHAAALAWPRRRPGRTTRCSSTATPAWARPTCCRPSPTTCGENYPTYRVRYVSTETFLNEFVDAIRQATLAEFKRRYREIDVLLRRRHPVHRGQGGASRRSSSTPSTSLHQANRQIVLSSDRPPDAIATLEDRLRSRFKMGLITDIQPPELETRLAILRKKAEREPIASPPRCSSSSPPTSPTTSVSSRAPSSGSCAYASLTGEPLSVDLAERRARRHPLRHPAPPDHPRAHPRPRPSEMFGFTVEDIWGKSRRRPLVTARQIGMYVMRELTDLSYPAIAREFGGRDHTTVIHAVEKIGALMKERRQIYDQVTELTQRIRNG